MTTVTHDAHVGGAVAKPVAASGLLFALASAASFGLSGSLGRGLIDAGWSPGAAVVVRILLGFVVLAVPALLALRGRWSVVRHNVGFLTGYGLAAVAAAQLCFFNAVAHMPVAVALLVEYIAPVAVVCWMWLRHGHVPTRLTVVGGLVALAGLVLLLDLGPGTTVTLEGVLWALGATTGLAVYFVLSADEGSGLPPIVLAAGGLLVGGAVILAAGIAGIVPLAASTAAVRLAGATVAWWVPAIGLAVVTAALAYTTGIAASRRLGPRLASFVGLVEVLMAVLFAWLLLDQLPLAVQLAGGALVVVGVVVVKAGEPSALPDDREHVPG
jgi:drug/metabolite transporter (DMT)-like permease